MTTLVAKRATESGALFEHVFRDTTRRCRYDLAPLPFHANQEAPLARKTIFVSDLSGEEIREKDAAQLVIKYQDARRGQVVLDVNANEVDDLARKGQKQARRGRRPKSETAAG